jgi:hypothetical protein
LESTGLILNITEAAAAIDYGRKGFATREKAEEGRLSYERGIAIATSAFKDASTFRLESAIDPYIIILAEFTFLNQELQFCEKTDIDSYNSLSSAIQSFNDAFLSLEIVEDNNAYKSADKAFPHNEKYRINGFPKDSFHIACKSHRTRLKNILRSPGIDPIEKALLKQRFANLATGQKGYLNMQKKAML